MNAATCLRNLAVTLGALLAVTVSACGTTGAMTQARALGEIRLVGAPGQGAEFYGDSDMRRRGVIAVDGRCALYELDEEHQTQRAVLGQRRVGEAGASRDRVAAWQGDTTSDGVERAMVFAPGAGGAARPDDSSGVRVGVVFAARRDRAAPWLLECNVPQTGRVGLPESLLVAIFATGRQVRGCSHDLCTIAEDGLIPMRAPTGETRRVALRAMSVEVQALPDAAAVLAERRSEQRVAIALDLNDAPPDLRVDKREQERRRKQAWKRTQVVMGEALIATN